MTSSITTPAARQQVHPYVSGSRCIVFFLSPSLHRYVALSLLFHSSSSSSCLNITPSKTIEDLCVSAEQIHIFISALYSLVQPLTLVQLLLRCSLLISPKSSVRFWSLSASHICWINMCLPTHSVTIFVCFSHLFSGTV